MSIPITEQLLDAYFAGNATASQIHCLEDWARKTPNRELFFARLAAGESQHLQFTADVDQAIKQHRQRITDLGMD